MPKHPALASIYFRINGKTFQCIGTHSTEERDDCIDTLKNLETQEIYREKRSHTMGQKITWLTKENFKESKKT